MAKKGRMIPHPRRGEKQTEQHGKAPVSSMGYRQVIFGFSVIPADTGLWTGDEESPRFTDRRFLTSVRNDNGIKICQPNYLTVKHGHD